MTQTPGSPEPTEPEIPADTTASLPPAEPPAPAESKTSPPSSAKSKPRATAAEKRAAAMGAMPPGAAFVQPGVSLPAAESPAAATVAAPASPSVRRGFTMPVAAAIVAAALVGGVSGAGVSLWAVSMNQTQSPAASSGPAAVTVGNPGSVSNITAVALKASASVVTISVSSDNQGGTGSGVVLTKDGYILTNTHVVTLEGAASSPSVKVQTNDGRLLDATIVGTDPIADLAVIKVNKVNDLVPAEFADSDTLNVGDSAIAIGAPLGLAGTVTDGIISSLNRSISIASSAAPKAPDGGGDSKGGEGNDGGKNGGSPFDFWQFDLPGQNTAPTKSSGTISLAVIQTDAAINPGNSGGALLDSSGRVIGINVAIASAGASAGQSGNIGVGFAIPSTFAKRIADEIIATGSATHGLLGAAVLDVTEDADAAGSTVVGASVKEVTPGGAADAAGIKTGDVITAFNGVRITGKTDITAQVRAVAAGSSATLTYVRGGKSTQVTVTLGTLTS